MKRASVVLLAIIAVSSCTFHDKKKDAPLTPAVNAYAPYIQMINEGFAQLKEGDLVLRNGQELSSQLIRSFSKKDKTYSHAGVVIMENGYPMIYHILLGGESPDQKFRKDSMNVFCNPRKNFGFGIYRYDFDSTELQNYKKTLLNWYQKGVLFDSDFDYQTNDKMYCSEMIAKALGIATNNRINIEKTKPTEMEAQYFSSHYNHPLDKIRKLQVVALDNLYMIPDCRLVKAYNYNINQAGQ